MASRLVRGAFDTTSDTLSLEYGHPRPDIAHRYRAQCNHECNERSPMSS